MYPEIGQSTGQLATDTGPLDIENCAIFCETVKKNENAKHEPPAMCNLERGRNFGRRAQIDIRASEQLSLEISTAWNRKEATKKFVRVTGTKKKQLKWDDAHAQLISRKSVVTGRP